MYTRGMRAVVQARLLGAAMILWLSGLMALSEGPSRAYMPQHGIPTPAELHEACPEEYLARQIRLFSMY